MSPSAINTKPKELPGPGLLHELVSLTSASGKPAIDGRLIDGSRVTLSYAEFHDASDSLADKIRQYLSPASEVNRVVPVLLHQSPDLYVSQLAILKAGAAFCPLNLDAPPERVRFILDDVDAEVLITTRDLQSRLPSGLGGVKVLVLDDVKPLGRNGVNGGLSALAHSHTSDGGTVSIDPSRLAYVMYTSGSTGTPKGVGISHRAATQSLLAHERHIPTFRRFIQFAAPTFDVSVFEIFFPLFRGATLVCCTRDEMLDDLPGVLRQLDIDACELTPSVAGSLLRKRENVPGLELLLTIGEMLSEPVVKEFGGTPERKSILWAMYGPTEASIHCTIIPAKAADSLATNIGVPLDTVSCFVIPANYDSADPASFKLVEAGEVGELAVGGHQNALGYLKRPDQTALAFINTPFGPMYRTGDLARLQKDGTLECLGRMSEGQVKLRGQRIELGEVEHAVLKTPGCHSAVAAVINRILVVFCAVDSRDDGNTLAEAVAQKCSEWLPAFMVPGDIVVTDQFPRLPSGKVDRKLMKANYENATAVSGSIETEGGQHALSSLVAKCVLETLAVEVGPRTVLASAGVDSLGAIRLASRLRNEGFQVSALQVLKARMINDLCLYLTEARCEETGVNGHRESTLELLESVVKSTPLLRELRDDVVSLMPCTPLQSSMLFETTRNPWAYCNVIELTFSPEFDAKHIRDAFNRLASTAEVLRTGFIHNEGQFQQVVFQALRKSQVSVVQKFDKAFQLSDDTAFLYPLRLQILDSEEPRALLQLHHSIYDGWSMDMILADWQALLRREDVRPRPPFSRVVSFYNTIEKTLEESRRFWAEHLLGWEKMPLPRLSGRVEQPNQAVSSRSRVLGATKQDVMAFSRRNACSPQVPFQAALLWLWSSILGAEDVVIGSVTSGRTVPVTDIERIIGPCIASMPLRANLSSVATLADLVNLVQSNNRAIIEHATLPLAEIRKLTTLSGSQSIYDVLFVYQESLVDPCQRGNEVIEVSHLDALETPVLLEVEPKGNTFSCSVTYHTRLIQPAFVEILIKQFDCIVDVILQHPASPLTSIRDGFPAELQSIYSPEVKHYEGRENLADVVESTARSFPENPAVYFARSISGDAISGQSLSFGELNILANRIARWIRKVSPAVHSGIITVILEKSALLYASVLGILKAGYAYLPILPSTPIARVQAIVNQSGASVCVTDSSSCTTLRQAGLGTILDVERAGLDRFQHTSLGIAVDFDQPAYVIYTSGTTGKPKGVVITHRNIVSHLDILEKIYPVGANPRLLQSCSQAFDVSVFEIFFAWKTGMCVCSATNDALFDDLERSIRSLRITHLSMTPTVASIVRRKAVPGVRFLVTAGEPMTQAVFEEWKDVLYQGYGPSETTNICTVKKMTDGDYIEHLGFTFDNTSVFVFFPDSLTPTPIGCVGEFCFGGEQVAQGYLNEPELTASKFITHPTYGPLYRSGDLGRMLPDRSLLIIGRLDDQIKLRGQRIDVGEISSIVTRSGLAASSVVLPVSRAKGAPKQLAIFYTASANAEPHFQVCGLGSPEIETQSTLFASFETLLPSYMVPSYLIPISRIPMTSSGKIEKKLLAAAFSELNHDYLERSSQSARAALGGSTALSTEETLVAEAISAALKVDKNLIGRWTPLASVGLDSITAIQTAKHLSQTLGKRTAISAILQNPFVAQLASVLFKKHTEKRPNGTHTTGYLISDGVSSAVQARFDRAGLGIEAILPCTPLQEAMLAAKDDTTYYNNMVLRLNAPTHMVRSSWETMYKRHGILRTAFISTDDRKQPFVQVVLQKPELPWHAPLPGSSIEAYQEHLRSNMGAAKDSMSPPFALGTVIEDGRTYLCFVCHHAMYDGVAMSILLSEVEGVTTGSSLQPPVTYEPFLREALTLPESTDKFWKDQFRDFRPARLLRSEAPGDIRTSNTHTVHLDVPLDELEARAHSIGISLLSVSQAVWANVLSIATGTRDVCFGNVMNGRNIPVGDVDRLVAPCFNTVPLRVDLSENSQWTSLLKYLHRLNPAIIEYQFTPLRRIKKVVGQPQGLFDTLLILQPAKTLLDPEVWHLVSDDAGMDVPLVCEICPDSVANEIGVNLIYDKAYFSHQFVMATGNAMNYLLSFLTHFPSSALRQLHDLPEQIQLDIRSVDVTYIEPEKSLSAAGQGESDPWTDLELKIRDIFAQLSSVAPKAICKRTTIFQLGMDSINAVQVAGMLRKRGVPATATDILNYPTCEDLAKRLDQKPAEQVNGNNISTKGDDFQIEEFRKRVAPLVQCGRQPVDITASVLPCTPVQVAMLTEFVQSQGRGYFNYINLNLDVGIPISTVLEAWRAVFSTQEMLRVGFTPLDSQDYPDMSYVMVKYDTSAPAPVSVIPNTRGFSAQKWKLDMAHDVLMSLHQPPWRVALAQEGDRVSMHIAIHHALYDAHSLRQILDDLAQFIRGDSVQEATSVSRAVTSILGLVEVSDRGDAKEFWSSFADDAVVNDFPVMTPLRVERGELLSSSYVSALTFDDLLHATRNANISVQAALQGAWTRVLSSYEGEDSVIFGTVMSGRVSEALQNTAFPCLTTVPIIARNSRSNEDLLQSMMEFNTGLYKHQFSRLTAVQRWLGHPGRRLFDTLLVYQRLLETDGTTLPWAVIEDEGVVGYPVSLEVEPQKNRAVKLRITFQSDVLPQEQASLMMAQFDAALRHLVWDPRGSVESLWGADPRLAAMIPTPMAELPSEVALLHQFVELQAQRQPQKVALEFVEAFNGGVPVSLTWTFSELNSMGNRVAATLACRVTPGSVVAIHFNKCPDAYFSILGILKAGCSFLALDPAAPRARKEFILGDSKAAAVLVGDSAQVDFDPPAPVIDMKEISAACVNGANDIPDISPQSACYCLYTSGTTGTPKGCEITHENAVQAMLAFQELFTGHWDEDSRCLQFASLHFDVSVLEQYWSWSVGVRLMSAPRDLVLDDLEGTISRLGITHIDLTPSLASLVRPGKVPSLQRGVFITGGEQLKQEILDAWGPKGTIWNFYGPTEATIGVTVRRQVPSNGRPANIGQQFPNVGTYVFHQGTEILVPRGGVGELCVSGKLVGKGYLGRKALTAERFPVVRPWGERVYRTGDLVRLFHDGSFDFLGRADDQVKLRGQRLQLGEIDHAIRSGAPGVLDVATLVATHGKTGKDLLVSFIVPLAPDQKSSDALKMLVSVEALNLCREAREACKDKVPGYMVPTYVVPLSFIPLSRNNKTEFKALRAFFNSVSAEDLSRLSAPVTQKKTSTGLGANLIKFVAEFTGREFSALDLETNIFELGLDSISIPRLSRVLKQKGVPASSETILMNPVLGDLIQALEEAPSHNAQNKITGARQLMRACGHRYRGLACRELSVQHEEIEYLAPCTPIQQGMLSRALAGGHRGSTYFNGFRLALREGVSLERLRRAWEAAIEKHAILRSQFVATPEGFVQVALRKPEVEWHDIASTSNDDPQEGKGLYAAWLHDNSVHVTRPLEFVLDKNGKDAQLVIHAFHGLYDGNSFDTLLKYVSSLYRGEIPATGPDFEDVLPLGPLWRYDFCREFWVEHLRGWRPIELPTSSHFTNDTEDEKFGDTKEELDVYAKDILVKHVMSTEALERLRRTLGVTLQAVVLGLWVSTLQRHVSDSIATGVIVSGRSLDVENIENCIGPLFNTLPFFAEPCQGDTWRSLVRKCHDFAAAVSAFQHVSLRDIQRWCSNGRPLFDNLFAFQVEEEEKTGEPLWVVEEEEPAADYPLAFEGKVRGRILTVSVLASGSLMGRKQVERLLRTFRDFATELVGDPDAHIGPMTTLPQPEGANGTSEIRYTASNTPLSKTAVSEDARLFLQELRALCGLEASELFGNQTLANLGLDSIDIVKLSARLRSQGVTLTTTEVTRCADIGEVVSLLGGRDSLSTERADQLDYERLKADLEESVREAGFGEEGVEDILPPTPLQEIMVSHMLQTRCQQYFNHDLLEVGSDVDMERLVDSWTAVWEKSPVLRTVFVEVVDPKMDLSFCQVVLPPRRLEIGRTRIDGLSQVQDVIQATKDEATGANGRDKLFRLHVLSVGGKNYVLLSIAHALYDGWSLALLHQDVEEAYRGQAGTRPSSEVYLRRIHSTSSESAEFWDQHLLGARPTAMPTIDEEAPLYRAEAVSNISAQTVSSFGRTHGVSIQVLGQACWAAVLGSRTSSLDLTFGVVLSGRDFEGAEELMFPTMNTVAVRYVLHGTVAQFLRYMEEGMAGVRTHQAYPLRKALKGRALFNSLFLFQKAPFEGNDERRTMTSVESSSAVEYPVCVELEFVGEELVWRTACQGAFDAKGAEMLLHQLDRVLGYLVQSPEREVLSFEHPRVSICGLAPVRLAEMEEDEVQIAEEEDGEWTDTEDTIRDVISQVSRSPAGEISRSTTLYSVGLDSISAIKVAANLRRQGIHISVRELLTGSIKDMARFVKSKAEPKTTTTPPSEQRKEDVQERAYSTAGIYMFENEVESILPALPMQVYMLSTSQNSRGTVFHPTFRYQLVGEISKETLETAWSSLVREMPLLRTCFAVGEDWPFMQIVLKGGSIVQRRGRVLRDDEKMDDHDLVRMKAHGGENGWLVGIRIHHALYDAVSMEAILSRFAELCGGAPEKETDTAPWRIFTRAHTSWDAIEARRVFWTKYLSGVKTEPGIVEWPSMARTSYFVKDIIDVSSARTWCAKTGVSFQALFFAIYARVLGRTNPGASVVFGVYLANRSDASVSDMYPTLNLVPLRVELVEDLGPMAKAVQGDIHAITAGHNAGVGLWEVERWTGVRLHYFVNFIISGEEIRNHSDGVRLEAMEGEEEGSFVPGWMEGNDVRGCFPAAVDVEASVTEGKLNIGVFSPRFLLDEEEAREVVTEIKEMMGGL